MKKVSKTCNFGEHITIDGYDCNPEKLGNKKLVLKCLGELPTLLKLKKLSKPLVCFAPDTGKKDPGGWSGFVVIAESHISIHTFPARKFISADVYSCKNGLDKKFIVNYFRKKFGIKAIEENFVKRGKKYPLYNLV